MLAHDHVSLSNQPVKIEVNCCVMSVHSSTGEKTKLQSIMICKCDALMGRFTKLPYQHLEKNRKNGEKVAAC